MQCHMSHAQVQVHFAQSICAHQWRRTRTTNIPQWKWYTRQCLVEKPTRKNKSETCFAFTPLPWITLTVSIERTPQSWTAFAAQPLLCCHFVVPSTCRKLLPTAASLWQTCGNNLNHWSLNHCDKNEPHSSGMLGIVFESLCNVSGSLLVVVCNCCQNILRAHFSQDCYYSWLRHSCSRQRTMQCSLDQRAPKHTGNSKHQPTKIKAIGKEIY